LYLRVRAAAGRIKAKSGIVTKGGGFSGANDRMRADDDDDADDPVVEEIPLFHSSRLGSRAVLMQFPLIGRAQTPNVQMATRSTTEDSYSFVFLRPTDVFSSGESERYLVKATPVRITQPLALGAVQDGALHLTPIHQVYQGRPVQADSRAAAQELPGVPIDWYLLEDASQFTSSILSDSLASAMSVTLFQSKLADLRSDLSPDLAEGVTDETIQSRSPREQLYLRLLKDRTILFHEFLKVSKLQAHAHELLDVLLQYAYFVQGRWTIKPDEMPERALPKELRLPCSFFIVLFAHDRTLSFEGLTRVFELFGVKRQSMPIVLEKLGLKQDAKKHISFRWKASTLFEDEFKEAAQKGRLEILKLKEAVCNSKRDPYLFDEFLA
jgi:hypothetical protein